MNKGEWYYSPEYGQLCQVIKTRILWGDTTCRVWLPGSDSERPLKPALSCELKLRAGKGYDKVKNWFVKIGNKANVEVSHV